MTAHLTLTPADRQLPAAGGFTNQVRGPVTQRLVRYLDWTTDGVRVHDLLERARGEALDYVGPLDEWDAEDAADALRRLLGELPSDLPSGRKSLYVCPECHDLGCGAVTAEVAFAPETVTWSRFGIETDYDPTLDHEGFEGVGPFTFDRGSYEETLRAQLARFTALADEQRAARQAARANRGLRGLLRRVWRRPV